MRKWATIEPDAMTCVRLMVQIGAAYALMVVAYDALRLLLMACRELARRYRRWQHDRF